MVFLCCVCLLCDCRSKTKEHTDFFQSVCFFRSWFSLDSFCTPCCSFCPVRQPSSTNMSSNRVHINTNVPQPCGCGAGVRCTRECKGACERRSESTRKKTKKTHHSLNTNPPPYQDQQVQCVQQSSFALQALCGAWVNAMPIKKNIRTMTSPSLDEDCACSSSSSSFA